MPLVKPDYYTLQEALGLIKETLPDEDALENLREALHSRSIAAWIIDGDGRRVEIPHNLWLSFSLKFHLTFSIERGTAKFKEPGGLGAWRFPAVEGPIRIDRAQLDALRARVGVRVLAQEPNPQPDEARPTVTRPLGRRSLPRDSAKRALDTLYPKGIPSKPWKTLHGEVNDWLAANNGSPVGVDTVRRAANRK